MVRKSDSVEVYDDGHLHISHASKDLLPLSPIIVTSSEIEVVALPNLLILSPPTPQLVITVIHDRDAFNTTTNILTCNSTATDDMLDTVDDCVGCVNQISLQHHLEDSLRDVSLNLYDDSIFKPTRRDDFEKRDSASNIEVSEVESLRFSAKSCNDVVAVTARHKFIEESQQYSEISLLSWCSGGFHGVKPLP